MQLITITEADASLDPELYPDWENLEDPAKNDHIDHSSAYTALNWRDPLEVIDFTDVATIPADVKDVIAKYADADRAGDLYRPCGPGETSKAPINKLTLKVGSLESTTEYAQSNLAGGCSPLKVLSDELLYIGLVRIFTAGQLARV